MSALYFSYDPENGIRFHPNEKEAESRASGALQDAIDYAADGDWHWTENEGDISYGVLLGKVSVTERALTEEERKDNPDWSAIRSHKLETVAPPTPAPDEAKAGRVTGEMVRAARAESLLSFVWGCLDPKAPHGAEIRAEARSRINALLGSLAAAPDPSAVTNEMVTRGVDAYCGMMNGPDWTPSEAIRAALQAAIDLPGATPAPLDLVLHCPSCHLQHIDAPDERTPDWKNEPHRSHLCHGCGFIWRPADVPTNGVAAVMTKGKADSAAAQPVNVVPLRTVTAEQEESAQDIIIGRLEGMEQRGILLPYCDDHNRDHITEEGGEEYCRECVVDEGGGELVHLAKDTEAIEMVDDILKALGLSKVIAPAPAALGQVAP